MAEIGRPTVMTDEAIRKIEEVAALDGSVAEMAYYAGIHPDTIYAHLKENKDFSDRITALREKPILKARQTVVQKMSESYQNAVDYLKRKRKLEFGDSMNIDANVKIEATIEEKEAVNHALDEI